MKTAGPRAGIPLSARQAWRSRHLPRITL